MKKVNTMKWLSFFLMAILSVGLMACSDDDDDEEFSLIGMWEYSYNGGYDLYQFNKDGTGKGATSEGVNWTFRYDLNAETLKLVYTKENELAEIWNIESISSSSIKINGEWILSRTNKKIDDIEEKPQYEAVDLGLSVKWATCNVGASKPEEYGDYYAWGETTTKSDYSWDTYKWCGNEEFTVTKYCTDSCYGTVDNLTTLTSSDDVATVKWGSKWRMPTKEERNELEEDCTWTWTSQNGVNGMKVTGPNGNSIFLPAGGSIVNTRFDALGSELAYWTATLHRDISSDASNIGFNKDGSFRANNDRSVGRSVRPVTE